MLFPSIPWLGMLRQVLGFEIMSALNYLQRNGGQIFKNYASRGKLLWKLTHFNSPFVAGVVTPYNGDTL